MSIKEDIESIKSDMVGDGKSLEIVIKIERQLKKHKAKIYATFAIAAIIIIANISNNYIQEERKFAANEAFLALSKDSTNTNAKMILSEKNPALLALLELQTAAKTNNIEKLKQLQNSPIEIVATLASYQITANSDDKNALEQYLLNEKALMKDFARLQLAQKQYKSGELNAAHDSLSQIPFTSMLKNSSSSFEHYGLK